MQIEKASEKQLVEVNGRLERGEGWVGYLKQGGKDSKYLYILFYNGKTQERINTKTNDLETAYRMLLDNRKRIVDGEKVLPAKVGRITYENLIENLMDYYRQKFPASIRTRKAEDGTKEETFDGKDNLDEFFGGMSISDITAKRIQDYIRKYTKMGYSGPTIRRQLTRLQSAFERTKDLDQITASHIPSFRLPKDSDAREGFLEYDDFVKLQAAMPEHLHLTMLYVYFTGSRMGEIKQITWDMVSKDCDEIHVSPRITKTKKGRQVPLVGPLAVICAALKQQRKTFPKGYEPVFNMRNFRRMWNRACHKLGLGVYDESTDNRKYSGLHPHDFRRSAARNLIKAGVPRSTAMLITGHKTEAVFERYNIKDTSDVKDALIKVGEHTKGKVADINEAR